VTTRDLEVMRGQKSCFRTQDRFPAPTFAFPERFLRTLLPQGRETSAFSRLSSFRGRGSS
jgi:hypothetical protein